MIEIKHRVTGEVLRVFPGNTLVKADLTWTHLSGADLTWAHLNDGHLSYAHLSNADLSGANLSAADLSGADLSGANLTWANLTWANLIGANLVNANLTSANLGRANLSRADLRRTNLRYAHMFDAYLNGTNLKGAHLRYADLIGAQLDNADLTSANLSRTNLSRTNLSQANLSRADLSEANLREANLRGADLREAELREASLSRADLTDTNLNRTKLVSTKFLECNTLHLAKGLETVRHTGPSSLDAHTLRASIEHLPDVFLRGVGYNDEEIDVLRGLYGKAFRFYSCFISYARANNNFAERLFSDLQANGVTCWKDTEHMKGGDYWQSQINKAINVHDKVILICSEQSLVRRVVIDEILNAIKEQKKTGQRKLFPIRLDDFIFSEEIEEIGERQTATGEWPSNWLSLVKAFHIPDFSEWKKHDVYQKAFQKLLKDLKAESKTS